MKIRNSLRSKVTLTLILMSFTFALILLLVVQSVSTYSIRNYIYNDIYSRQYEMYDGISEVLDEVNLLYSRMVLNENFETVLEDDTISQADKNILFKQLMSSVGINQELFGDVTVYYNETLYRLNDSISLPSTQFIQQVMASNKLIEQGNVIQGNNQDSYLVIGKRMVNFPTGDVKGSIIFYINEKVLIDICSNISGSLGYSFVVSNDSYVVTHSTGKYLGATIFDADIFSLNHLPNYEIRNLNGIKSIIIVNQYPDFNNQYGLDWKIISVISYNTLFKDILQLNNYYLILGIIMAVLATIVAFRISNGITKPINKIISGLRKFSVSGKKDPFKKVTNHDELWELEKTYDEMVERITNLIDKNKSDMENQRKLELYTLQMQINPHFLYNTLDAIAWMAKIKKQRDIEKLVLALAKFFRISLHKGDKFITVHEEIELIQNFMQIELIRFPDKFTIEYEVDENVQSEETLKLILQPIVENAIKHGISQLEYIGHITIKVSRDDRFIYFEIIDDGLGFDVPIDLFADNRLLSSTDGGYGLKNVDERIKLEYGRDCGIIVTSKPKGGTQVLIKIKRRYIDK